MKEWEVVDHGKSEERWGTPDDMAGLCVSRVNPDVYRAWLVDDRGRQKCGVDDMLHYVGGGEVLHCGNAVRKMCAPSW